MGLCSNEHKPILFFKIKILGGNKMTKRILAIVLCALMVFTCFIVTSCSPEDQNTDNSSTGTSNNNDKNIVPLDDVPDVATMDGTPMVSNTAYAMSCSGMVFATPTAYSRTASEGITLQASVEPSFATKTAVDWSVSFANPESSWATGKTVTDYVTITPISDGSLTATLECVAPFGEQIIVKVTSRENAEISDTCPLEYMRRVENVYLTIGDNITLNANEPTYIDFEVATGNRGKGGKVSLHVDFTDTYTIESWAGDNYDATDLTQWGVIAGNSSINDDTTFEGQLSGGGIKFTGYPNFCYSEWTKDKAIYFDVDSLSDLGAYLMKDSAGAVYNLNNEDPEFLQAVLTDAKARGTDTIFWFEVIHPTNHRIHFEVKLGDIVNSGVAPKTINLKQSGYNFNATELDYLPTKE